MKEKTFNVHYAKRARVAWIIAEKQYLKLTEEEKEEIINKIRGGGSVLVYPQIKDD
jgi:hypothetical protein